MDEDRDEREVEVKKRYFSGSGACPQVQLKLQDLLPPAGDSIRESVTGAKYITDDTAGG